MPSTAYAAVRAFLEAGQTDTLMRMLDDRLNYGLFPSDAVYVMLLNHFLVRENWRDAAKVGMHMTLQEDGAVPIAPLPTRSLPAPHTRSGTSTNSANPTLPAAGRELPPRGPRTLCTQRLD